MIPANKLDTTATESSGEGICLLSPNGQIVSYNGTLATILGRTSGSITGSTCREVFKCTKEDERHCPLTRIKSDPRRHSISIRHGALAVTESVEPVFDDTGCVVGILLSFIPNRKDAPRVTHDLIKLQRLETISQAAGGIVHDLNNMLMCMDAEIMLLQKKLKDMSTNHGTDESLSSLRSVVVRGQGLTHHLLKLSKGQKPDTGPTAIGEIIREAVHFSLIGSHLNSKVKISNELWPIRSNTEQIFQLISNLVINAKHATTSSNKGHITITADNLSETDIEQAGLNPGKYVKISIMDQGQGIPLEQLDRIFEPFFTTKPDGTGLGLALVNLIVKELSGHITVESAIGKGSKFTVFIPALDLESPARSTGNPCS